MRDNIRLAFQSLKANGMRTILTMLGIIIGITSVISILTIADAMKAQMAASLASMGLNNVSLSITSDAGTDAEKYSVPSPTPDSTKKTVMPDSYYLTVDQINDYRDTHKDMVQGISYSLEPLNGTITMGHTSTTASVQGISVSFPETIGLEAVDVTSGRWITDEDNEHFRKVTVIREDSAISLFGSTQNALGKVIDITIEDPVSTISATIVGTYKGRKTVSGGMMGGGSIDFSSYFAGTYYIPMTVHESITGVPGVTQMVITGTDTTSSSELEKVTQDYFDSVYKCEGYVVQVEQPYSSGETDDTMKTLQTAFAAIAAISLLVGGIGVMNIMMVSITERTREIGVRKALGAKRNQIRLQFITESVVICLVGGLIGVLLGIGLGLWMSSQMGYPTFPSLFSILLSFGFSLVIGVFFGYYPANKAAKLQPLDALRYE